MCLQDLSNYKYDKMINKSLALLNKYYSSKTKLFKMAVQAMVSYKFITHYTTYISIILVYQKVTACL